MVDVEYDRRRTATPCQWSLSPSTTSPHSKELHEPRPKICSNVLEAVGHTPVIRLNNISKQFGINCELLAKCEFMNPCGSVKDRIGCRIIADLERTGQLKPGMTLAEPTSGNTGIGLAMAAAVKGYKLVCAMPERMSQEKSDILQAMGAQVIRTPSEARFNTRESHLGVCEAMAREDPQVVLAGQHFRPFNPLAHYDHTAEEILQQVDGKLDYLVLSVGSGGQLTGISRKLKERIPGIVVVGVDADGSILHDPENAPRGFFKVEGVGNNSIVPRACYTDLVDKWVVVSDHDAFHFARNVIRNEGLLIGGSSGAILFAAVQICKTIPADKRVICVLPDGITNYLSKFLSDRWMIQNGFIQVTEAPELAGKTIRDLNLASIPVCKSLITIQGMLEFMKINQMEDVPVVLDGSVLGVVSALTIHKKIIESGTKLGDSVQSVLTKSIRVFGLDTNLTLANIWVQDMKYALVQESDSYFFVYPRDISLSLIN